MKKFIFTMITFVIFAIGYTATNNEVNSNKESSDLEFQAEQKQDMTNNKNRSLESPKENDAIEMTDSSKDISQIKDKEELLLAINNTIWTHTKRGDAWLRYEFVGNIVKQYGALKRNGEWRYDGESQFELREMTSNSDGEKYFAAIFMPKTESLAMFELPVTFNFNDYHLYLNGQDIGGFTMVDYDWD